MMKIINIYYIIGLMMMSLFSCENMTSNINYLDVHFLPNGSTPTVPFFCAVIDNYNDDVMISNKHRYFVKIKDQRFLKKFEKEILTYKELSSDKEYEVRIKTYVHYKSGIVDTLCLGVGFGTYLNGNLMQDHPELLSMLKQEIDYDNAKKHAKNTKERLRELNIPLTIRELRERNDFIKLKLKEKK